ncbi:YidH family protein [Bacillus thuringiensis]|uniref:YidH family protein n=1 Tax=Bacillus thuringiensis TaxID=1428 RepID=UPI0005C6E7F0|nr:DUF202 domain-containing protein [Bacillus thuringiensis]
MEQHKVKSKALETVDSKYIQRHLANERTYLAWLRTAIAIAGLGFLVANFHLAVRKELSSLNNKIAIGIGIGSVIAGISIIIATLQYLIKRQNIPSTYHINCMVITLSYCSYFSYFILFFTNYIIKYYQLRFKS